MFQKMCEIKNQSNSIKLNYFQIKVRDVLCRFFNGSMFALHPSGTPNESHTLKPLNLPTRLFDQRFHTGLHEHMHINYLGDEHRGRNL